MFPASLASFFLFFFSFCLSFLLFTSRSMKGSFRYFVFVSLLFMAASLPFLAGQQGNGTADALRTTQSPPPFLPDSLTFFGSRAAHLAHKLALSHIIVDHSARLLFCFVPKNACTQFKQILYKDALGLAELPPALARNADQIHYVDDLPLLSSLSLAERRRVLSSYHRAMFVRNPYSRLLSCYRDKVVSYTKKTGTVMQFVREFGLSNMTFDEFVEAVTVGSDPARTMWEEHLTPQAMLCDIDTFRPTFVGRFEHLAEDANKLFALVNITARMTSGAAWHATNATSQDMLDAYADPATRALVQQHYARDFKEFRYSTSLK
uniref:Carbohydrate sulfotransferase n=1 Tax=Sexangularia sp. CB-2014 TaxID=1486929 RepID=A0A7S1YD35_9EUKA